MVCVPGAAHSTPASPKSFSAQTSCYRQCDESAHEHRRPVVLKLQPRARATLSETFKSTKKKLSPVDKTHFSKSGTVSIPLSVFLSAPGLKPIVTQPQTHRPLLPGGTRCCSTRVWVKKKKRRREGEEFQSKSTAVEKGTTVGLQWNLTAPSFLQLLFSRSDTHLLLISKRKMSYHFKVRQDSLEKSLILIRLKVLIKKLENLGVIAGILLCIKRS